MWKKRLFIVFCMVVLLSSISTVNAVIDDDYDIVGFEGFESNDISAYTISAEGFSVISSGCLAGTYCLQHDPADGGWDVAVMENSSFIVNTSDDNVITANIYPDHYTAIAFLYNANNDFVGLGLDHSGGNIRLQEFDQTGTSYSSPNPTIIDTAAKATPNWDYMVINVTPVNYSVWVYENQSMGTLLLEVIERSYPAGTKEQGYVGFYGGGNNGNKRWDNLTIWELSEGAPPPATNNDFVTVSFDSNISSYDDVWSNWTTAGNYSYTELRRNDTLVYNGSNKYYNDTTVSNNTQYFYNITVFWNSTIFNSTLFNLTVPQYYVTLADIYNKILDIENDVADVDDIWEEINMIWLIGAWLFIYAGAIWLMLNSNFLVGAILWYWNYSFDFFVITELFNRYSAARVGTAFYTTAYGLFFVGLLVWCVIKFLIPFMIRKPMRG